MNISRRVNIHQQGFILVLTMMLLSIVVLLVTQLFHKGSVHIHFDQAMIHREKAKSLALGGISLALSQVSIIQIDTQPKDTKEQEQKDPKLQLLKNILPALNRWQEFVLREDIDGIEGVVKICVSCENGTIDIMQLYDLDKKQFKGEGQVTGDMKKMLQDVFASMKKFTRDKNLFDLFEKFLKQQNRKLDDVTQLLTISDFEKIFGLWVFYEPPEKGSREKRSIYLTDLFTVWSDKPTLQPWLLSDSVLAIANLKRAEQGDIKKREQIAGDIIKEFKKQTQIQEIWNKQLQPLYGKDFKSLNKEL